MARGKRGSGRGSNLTAEDRRRGGKVSARKQSRDEQGRFEGTSTGFGW